MVWGLVILGIGIGIGIGWALVLDGLARNLNLRDVYWTPLGDESLSAVRSP